MFLLPQNDLEKPPSMTMLLTTVFLAVTALALPTSTSPVLPRQIHLPFSTQDSCSQHTLSSLARVIERFSGAPIAITPRFK